MKAKRRRVEFTEFRNGQKRKKSIKSKASSLKRSIKWINF